MLNSTLSDGEIRELIKKGILQVGDTARVDQSLQPSSFDLSVGERMWAMIERFLPTPSQSVLDLVHKFGGQEIDLREGASLQRGRAYIIEMQESVNLDDLIRVRANAKSSSGRLNLQARLISDGNPQYDSVDGPFSGRFYMELVSGSFFPFLRTGTSLNQIRFSSGNPSVSDDEIYTRHIETPILYDLYGKPMPGRGFLRNGFVLSLDLTSEIVGFRAKNLHKEIDLQKVGYYDPEEFWKIISKSNDRTLRIDPEEFYILSTREGIALPLGYAGELAFVDPMAGRFSVHEAGFADAGFGLNRRGGNNLTLEVTSHERVIFVDGQRIGRLPLERMSKLPERGYGDPGLKSNYGAQRGPRLSKHFKAA